MTDPVPDWYREIDHTGDVGIEVSAPSLEALFERAALGMFFVLTDPATVEPRAVRDVVVEADDREALLVRWLSELNYVHVTQGWLFGAFTVAELGRRRLVGVARGEPFDADRHTVYTEIKAVTFHGLSITKQGGIWHARIIFDL